jgi:alpha-beta hydrolase superfamily lysophospholipase
MKMTQTLTTKFTSVFSILILSAASGFYLHAQSEGRGSTEVTFAAADGVKLYADVYRSAKGKKAPLILLFHQGGAEGRGEYGSYIAPRLVQNGFNVIAVDQRKGGELFKKPNRTVGALGGKEFEFCAAYPDLEATLRYARKEGFNGDRFAWGSSYSATLALRLASEYPKELTGVLAFSPAQGEPMQGCQPTDYAPAVKLPVLVVRPASEMQREASKQQFLFFEKLKFRTYIAENGVHGSSMLDPERVTGSVEEHWKVVLDFV